jgi:hypothetical protein
MEHHLDEYEWATPEDRAPHPLGEAVVPLGPWEYAVLEYRRGHREVGAAWFREEGPTLSVVARIEAQAGGGEDEWVWQLLAEGLFGADGYTMGYYRRLTTFVRMSNLATGEVREGLWDRIL